MQLDPNLFFVDFEKVFEVLLMIIVLSFFIERSLTVVFQTHWFINFYDGRPKVKGIKETIAFFVSLAVCWVWDFDAISIIIGSQQEVQIFGFVITAGIIAGGSKASLKLFNDVLAIRSNAENERKKYQTQ